MINSDETLLTSQAPHKIDKPSTTQGKLVLTAGIAAQTDFILMHILYGVKNFDEFNEDNDPHQEHDFGKSRLQAWIYFGK